MADHTPIEWTNATWNVITGCFIKSSGCKNCYAMKLAGTRLKHIPSRVGLTQDSAAGPVWNGQVRFNEEWLRQPIQWKRARKIFVVAHGDLFYEAVPDEWIDKVFAVMAMAPQHTFQCLTKRADRMKAYMKRFAAGYGPIERQIIALGGNPIEALARWPLPNVWLGVSCETQREAEERVPDLQDIPAAVRWVSAEPLLAEIRFDLLARTEGYRSRDREERDESWTYVDNALAGLRSRKIGQYAVPKIDWIVGGGESGSGARPSHPAWFRSLRDQCARHGTAYLHKQNGAFAATEITLHEFQNPLERHMGELVVNGGGKLSGYPETDAATFHVMRRVGKKASGRLLDGVQHDGYPEVQA